MLITTEVVEDATDRIRTLRSEGAYPKDIRFAITLKGWYVDRLGQDVSEASILKPSSQDVRAEALLSGTVADVREALGGLPDVDLHLAHRREPFGRNRSTLLEAFAAEIARRNA